MVQKVFSAELDQLHEMLDFVKSNSLSLFSPDLLDQIIVATEEVLVNIINYGYPVKKKGTIDIDCISLNDPQGINIVIKDNGIPFNPIKNLPSVLPPPSRILEKSTNSLGGYGIYIFTGLMDKVDYQRIDGENILSLTKFVPNHS